MKAITSVLLLFFAISIFAQSTSVEQKTLITKRTATWCPNCGSWGWQFAKALEALEHPNAILIRAHYSGDLQTKVAQDITENFDAIYQPEFYLNESRKNVGSTTWESKVDEFKTELDNQASQEANVSFNLEGNIIDNTISTSVQVEFLKDVEGDYTLAVYVLEDEISNNQSGFGGEAIHNGVLLRSMSGESFGTELVSGGTNAGTTASRSQTYSASDDILADRKFRLLAVVWKKEGDKYLVENVHSTDLSFSSSLEDIAENEIDVDILQDSELLTFRLNLDKDFSDGKIMLTSVDGKVLDIFGFEAKRGSQEITRILNNASPQIVLISISGDGRLLTTKKVLLK